MEYYVKLHNAKINLLGDGMRLEMESLAHLTDSTPAFTSTTHFTETLKKLERLMHICDHRLHRGHVYAMPPEARMTFVKMMDVESYLNKLLQTDAIREDLLQHFNRLNKVLSHPACEIIPQLNIDLDVIEVSGGYCSQISARRFLPCPIPEEKRGVVSPRTFVPSDYTTPPAPRFFEEEIMNSFPNIKTRVNFLNKFYQCLTVNANFLEP